MGIETLIPENKMNLKKTSLTLAITVALGQTAYAETPADEDLNTLNTTVIHAKSIKRDATIEKIEATDIDTNQIKDMEGIVKYIPGVNVSKGDDRWGSSGFNIRGLDEDRVAITVDGVPQGETLKNEGGQAYGYFKGSRNGVDIEALKRVEIVKGADAILSGSGALSGAVSFTTKDPSDFLAAEGNDTAVGVKLGYSGNNNEQIGSLSLANRTGNLESMIMYTQRDSDEYESYDMDALDIEGAAREIPDPQEHDTTSYLAKVIYHISENTEVGVVASQYKTETMTDAQSFNGGWYSNRIGDDTSDTKRIGVFLNHEQDTVLFDRIEVAYNDQSIDFEAKTTQHVTYDFGPFFRADEDRIDSRNFDQDVMQFTVDLVKSFELAETQHELTYGYEHLDKDFANYRRRAKNSNYDDLGWVEADNGALVPKSESQTHTVYALDTFEVTPGTQIRLGARFDDITYDAHEDEYFSDELELLTEISFSEFTWTVGVEHEINSDLSIEAGVSTGFRAPTIEELYIAGGTPDDITSMPNPDLEAEYATNFDVALVGNAGALDYRVGVFFSDYKDFIENVRVERTNPETGLPDPDGYLTPMNTADAEIKGLELALNLDLNQFGLTGFNTSLSAAYTDGEEDNGDPIFSVQPFNAVWSVEYSADNWGVAMYTNFTKGKDKDDAYNTDAEDGSRTYPLYLSNTATVIDLAGYYNVTENITLRAGVNNLTDKEYFLWDNVRFVDQADMRPGIGVDGDGVNRYSESGRNFEASINVMF